MSQGEVCVIVYSNSERTWVGDVYRTVGDAEKGLAEFGYLKERYGSGFFMVDPSGKGLRKARVEPATMH